MTRIIETAEENSAKRGQIPAWYEEPRPIQTLSRLPSSNELAEIAMSLHAVFTLTGHCAMLISKPPPRTIVALTP